MDAFSPVLDSIVAELASLTSNSFALTFPQGISLLTLKSHILLSYLHHLTLLSALRLSGASFLPSSLDEKASDGKKHLEEEMQKEVEELVWLRLGMDKTRPLEGKLKYQVEKLVRKAEAADCRWGEVDVEEVFNDPLSFRPNPMSLIGPSRSMRSLSVEPDKEQDTFPTARETSSSGAYRPPRIAPVPYPGTSFSFSSKRCPPPAPAAIRDHASLSTSLPHAESTSGLGGSFAYNTAGASMRAKHLAAMEEYEEANLTRLFQSKKEANRRRMDEADVALGGRGVSASHPRGRRRGGLEAEFSDVLGEIGKKQDRYGGVAEEAAKAKKRRKVEAGEVRGVEKRKKGAFDKAVRRSKSAWH